jgi:hypothetical protein
MYSHHIESIARVREYFMAIPETQALLLGGSIAHGYGSVTSDIDVMILVSPEEHQRRINSETLQFFSRELVTYTEGYVDGKYTSLSFLEEVALKGSEPARFAFAGSQVLFSRIDNLDDVLARIATYPHEQKLIRVRRFYAQFEAWAWYTSEALRLNNRYLLGVSVSKLVLFGSRLLLAHNEMLYPYHKWMLRVLADAPDKPKDMMVLIDALLLDPNAEAVKAFYESVKGYRTWETAETSWPNQFMLDSELNWKNGETPVDDL